MALATFKDSGMKTKYIIQDKTLTFCGFRKPHPHINISIIRIAFVNETEKSTIQQYINNAVSIAIEFYEKARREDPKSNSSSQNPNIRKPPTDAQAVANKPVIPNRQGNIYKKFCSKRIFFKGQ